jgi:hypothetical protein
LRREPSSTCRSGNDARHGALLGARDLAIEDRPELSVPGDGTISTAIAADGDTAYLALWEWRPASRTRRLVRVDR